MNDPIKNWAKEMKRPITNKVKLLGKLMAESLH
jgi:hypothetical protein